MGGIVLYHIVHEGDQLGLGILAAVLAVVMVAAAVAMLVVVIMGVRMHMVVMVMHSKNFLSVSAHFRAVLKYSQFVLIILNPRYFVKA